MDRPLDTEMLEMPAFIRNYIATRCNDLSQAPQPSRLVRWIDWINAALSSPVSAIWRTSIQQPKRAVLWDVRWFDGAKLEECRPAGHVIARWLTRNEHPCASIERDFHPDAKRGGQIEDPLPVHTLNFSILEDGGACMIESLTLDGVMSRSRYELPLGVRSAVVGMPIGTPLISKVNAGPWELFLPPGCRPRSEC